MARKRLTQVFPILLPLRQKQRRLFFRWGMYIDPHTYASSVTPTQLPVKIFKHKSLLLRKLGDTDLQLQINKVTNLQIASSQFSGILIKPNEVFSFWHLVDDISYKKGYKDGIMLSDGEVKVACGGGICQLANLLFWMILHAPLEVIERYRHGFDPFPDYGRVIPFGTGATLVNGWKDLKVKNHTQHTFQINIWFDQDYIYGDIRADQYPAHAYHIEERNHRFVRKADGIYRQNQIFRRVVDRKTGKFLHEEHFFDNDSLIKYELNEHFVVVDENEQKKLYSGVDKCIIENSIRIR
jgi:vancomycin resistance protein VanW